MGLVRPFIAAGAANVVANLWPIEDEASVEFSAAFHREYEPASHLRAPSSESKQISPRARCRPDRGPVGSSIGGYN